MKKLPIILIVVGVLAVLTLFQAAFIVDQTERAVVLEFGRPVGQEAYEPGLHFKIPFIQNVVFFDSRLLDYDAQPTEILTEDKKNMVVDNYARWRIDDPLMFLRKVKTIPGAQARLDDIIFSELRVSLGRYTLHEVISIKRQEIMDHVTERSRTLLSPYGIYVADVRIKRTDLPPENERAIFGRMRAERERIAKQYRSEGREQAANITARADKEKAIILAEAKREAEILRGQGDAEATAIYADALGQSPDFYSFKRSLEAYERALVDGSKVVLTQDSPFLKHFR